MPWSMSVCGGGLAVALDEVGLLRRAALEGALAEQGLHEGADVEPDLRPQRRRRSARTRPIGCRDTGSPRCTARVRRTGTYFHWSPCCVGAVERAGAPADRPVDREVAQAVERQRVEHAVLGVGERVAQASARQSAWLRYRRAPSTRRGRRPSVPTAPPLCRWARPSGAAAGSADLRCPSVGSRGRRWRCAGPPRRPART